MDVIENGVHKSKREEEYVWTTDEKILKKLEEFQDMKLGFMTHFGTYNQIGCVESWPLSDEKLRNRWSQWGIDWTDIESFKKQYWDLNISFNPTRFEPQRWANFLARNGFKYSLLPTKHHDGFCMWNTNETDYKTTSENCPFAISEYADVFGSLVKEQQKLGIMTGAYFSKADWHHEDFWPEEFKVSGNTHKHPGYDARENPEKWDNFRKFTKRQMVEIIRDYEGVDIMWIDGGWLRDDHGENLNMDEITDTLREYNPNLLMVNRLGGGYSEDYITPEQTIPHHYMAVPWESCISLGGGFSYHFEDTYMKATQLTKMFVEILCKGGNLALNIAPQPDGRLPNKAMAQVEQFGKWLNENDKAIFATRPIAPYWNGNCGLTRDKVGSKYLFVLWDQDDLVVPKYVYFNIDYKISEVYYKDEPAKIKYMGNRYRITMPDCYVDSLLPLCFVFEVK